MNRRLFDFLAVISLLLFTGLVVLWIWSYFPSVTKADPANGNAIYPPPHAVSWLSFDVLFMMSALILPLF